MTRSIEHEPCCRVELPSGQVVAANLTKESAIQIANKIKDRAFVWCMAAKMIVYRNWT